MERHAFAMKVKAGRMNDYRKKLGEIWPELTAFLDRNKVKNFSIWNAEDLIFGYYENEDGEQSINEVFTEKEIKDKLLRDLDKYKDKISTEQIIENVKNEMDADAQIYTREHKLEQ